jgi:nickel/cobalt exporter
MEFDSLFWVAFQSSLLLGLVHGINPCGHSWLVLAPLVAGQKRGDRVAFWTISFLAGTSLACLLLGLTLGAVSTAIPPYLEHGVEVGTSLLLLALGAALILNPGLLHHHGHDHPHHDHTEDGYGHSDDTPRKSGIKLTGLALFFIGFVNMIIPCPTAAIMIGYTLNSGSAWKATAIFGIYAAGTALTVAGVIFAIYRVTQLLEKLSRHSIETALTRFAGVVTLIFAAYSLLREGVL